VTEREIARRLLGRVRFWWRGWWHPPRARLRTRRRVLLLSAPVLVVLVALAASVVSLALAERAAVNAFNMHDATALRDAVDRLRKFAVIDAAAVPFAEGDLFVLEGRLSEAEKRFADALADTSAGDSCPVRINLELVREVLGDLAAEDGRIDDARRWYDSASQVVDGAPAGCFADSADPHEERRAVLADTRPRLQRKLAELKKPASRASGTPAPTPTPSPSPSPTKPPDPPERQQPGQEGQGPQGGPGGTGGQPAPRPGQPGAGQPGAGQPGQSAEGQGPGQPQGPGQRGEPGGQQPQAPAGTTPEDPNAPSSEQGSEAESSTDEDGDAEAGSPTTRSRDPLPELQKRLAESYRRHE